MSNQKPLVLRHLEDVSWRVLEEYPEVIKTMIRRQAGIYVRLEAGFQAMYLRRVFAGEL